MTQKNTRFSINHFTSVGLRALTEEKREHLKVSRTFDGLFTTELMCCSLERVSPDCGTTPPILEAESSSSDRSSDADSSSKVSSFDSHSESDVSDDSPQPAPRTVVRRPRLVNTGGDFPRRGRDDSRTPSPLPRHRRDSPRRRRDVSRSASPPRSCRDDDRRSDGRSGSGRNRRESPPPAGWAVSSAQRLGIEDATSFVFAFSATPRERTGPRPFS